jgi:hypothetical protein
MIIRILCYVVPFILSLTLLPAIHDSGIYPPIALLYLSIGVTLIGAILDVIVRTIIPESETY